MINVPVTDAALEAAKLALSVAWTTGSRIQFVAEAIVRARADADEAGYSRGLREGAASEREACLSDIQLAESGCTATTSAFSALWKAKRNIRARGEGGK